MLFSGFAADGFRCCCRSVRLVVILVVIVVVFVVVVSVVIAIVAVAVAVLVSVVPVSSAVADVDELDSTKL